jgi:hypothetical protein
LRIDWELFTAHWERDGLRGVLTNLQEILVLKRSKNSSAQG